MYIITTDMYTYIGSSFNPENRFRKHIKDFGSRPITFGPFTSFAQFSWAEKELIRQVRNWRKRRVRLDPREDRWLGRILNKQRGGRGRRLQKRYWHFFKEGQLFEGWLYIAYRKRTRE